MILLAWGMATIQYRVALEQEEVRTLREIVSKGRSSAQTITRARVLLLADENGPNKSNRAIREALNLSHTTPTTIRKRFIKGRLERALYDAPRPGQPKKVTPEHETFVVAIACTEAPEGHDHWTIPELRKALLAAYTDIRSVSDERIRQILLHAALKPWRKKNVVRAETDARV